jgi:hypothetical protein
MYCSKCGKENSNDARFCQNCGQSLGQEKPISNSFDYEFCRIERRSNFWGVRDEAWEAKVGNNVIAQIEFKDPGWKWSPDVAPGKNLELVSFLTSRGWEILTTDQFGFVTAMRRIKR